MDVLFFKNTEITGGFWKTRQKLAVETIIPYQEKAIKDQIPGIAPSHSVANFKAAAKKLELLRNNKIEQSSTDSKFKNITVKDGIIGATTDDFYGMVFQDSDVAKWIEAASFSLSKYPDSELEKRIDELIEIIGKAQEDDGYLDTYFTLKRPDQKFKNLHDAHELYCAGHMIEAGVAHYEATGKNNLLTIVCKLADCIYKTFILEKHEGYPGHPEVELALMKLYRTTKNLNYLKLAEHFINVRGVDSDFYKREMENRDWNVWGGESVDPQYHQAHRPVREQTEAVGHAVRAGYLYTAMADLAFETKDKCLFKSCKTLWKNITQKRMYITGGIGTTNQGEAFTVDYDLPNDTAYSETCAAISLMMFAKQMLRNEKLGEYGDVMETSLYNTVLSGMQLDGKKFFYVNPLEALPGISGISPTHRHTLPERPGWYGCACCPPNVARTITDIADYAWIKDDDVLYSVLFLDNELEIDGLKISEKTLYPYYGKIEYSISIDKSKCSINKFAVRVPAWSKNVEFNITPEVKNGFAYFDISKDSFITISIDLKLSVRKIYCNNAVHSNSGKTAFGFGPLIYCAEGNDNGDILNLFVNKKGIPEIQEMSDELSGIRRIKIAGFKTENTTEDSLYSDEPPAFKECYISLIPYYTWSNRGLNQMRVWLPEI
ncbi:MAG: glycoside hydrolase family 127 protein [Treponema sp.]|nr:glycoside hydrolase family 127 protein [Treponema sp.]